MNNNQNDLLDWMLWIVLVWAMGLITLLLASAFIR